MSDTTKRVKEVIEKTLLVEGEIEFMDNIQLMLDPTLTKELKENIKKEFLVDVEIPQSGYTPMWEFIALVMFKINIQSIKNLF